MNVKNKTIMGISNARNQIQTQIMSALQQVIETPINKRIVASRICCSAEERIHLEVCMINQ